MKTSNLSRLLTLIALLFVLVTSFSCNRGYGCPNNFSIDGVREMLHSLIPLLF